MAALTLQGILRHTGRPLQVIPTNDRNSPNAQLIITSDVGSEYADGSNRWAFPIYAWVNAARTGFETISGSSVIIPGNSSGGSSPVAPKLFFHYRILDNIGENPYTGKFEIIPIQTSAGIFDLTAIPPNAVYSNIPTAPAVGALLTSDLGTTVARQSDLTSGLALKSDKDPTALVAATQGASGNIITLWDGAEKKIQVQHLQRLDSLTSNDTERLAALANLKAQASVKQTTISGQTTFFHSGYAWRASSLAGLFEIQTAIPIAQLISRRIAFRIKVSTTALVDVYDAFCAFDGAGLPTGGIHFLMTNRGTPLTLRYAVSGTSQLRILVGDEAGSYGAAHIAISEIQVNIDSAASIDVLENWAIAKSSSISGLTNLHNSTQRLVGNS
jgi:hypothetical protein